MATELFKTEVTDNGYMNLRKVMLNDAGPFPTIEFGAYQRGPRGGWRSFPLGLSASEFDQVARALGYEKHPGVREAKALRQQKEA